ncbi:glycosyltransferase family 2 protein [Streptomyces sp. ST2-7A]|uniref:glycosyltransferase family 2 protein n=1 Tax=Streptomyces sp. ST2-7A TaxID=2907214 RepID=UPI001F48493E|nr:glycosyltransferase family 2 protein [Streptomyces sp. ST2-7A]MCE7083004.1 glycosyltransferase family 2 protein [Streptomyces sp. ST2-7A]
MTTRPPIDPTPESPEPPEPPSGDAPALWVVVPARDEETGLPATLTALAAQRDRDFALVVVDNASVDGTADVARRFASAAPFPVHVVVEPEPGAGSAADTGFRYAIGAGARLPARTDADCLPAPDRTARLRARLTTDADPVCGRSAPRRDERSGPAERRLLPMVLRITAVYGRRRRAHRESGYLTPYVLCHGHNIALTADLYVRCGGTPRIPLEEGDEDVILLNRARRHSTRVVRDERLVAHNGLRRLRAWGARRTLLWYWDRRYRPVPGDGMEVHIR